MRTYLDVRAKDGKWLVGCIVRQTSYTDLTLEERSQIFRAPGVVRTITREDKFVEIRYSHRTDNELINVNENHRFAKLHKYSTSHYTKSMKFQVVQGDFIEVLMDDRWHVAQVKKVDNMQVYCYLNEYYPYRWFHFDLDARIPQSRRNESKILFTPNIVRSNNSITTSDDPKERNHNHNMNNKSMNNTISSRPRTLDLLRTQSDSSSSLLSPSSRDVALPVSPVISRPKNSYTSNNNEHYYTTRSRIEASSNNQNKTANIDSYSTPKRNHVSIDPKEMDNTHKDKKDSIMIKELTSKDLSTLSTCIGSGLDVETENGLWVLAKVIDARPREHEHNVDGSDLYRRIADKSYLYELWDKMYPQIYVRYITNDTKFKYLWIDLIHMGPLDTYSTPLSSSSFSSDIELMRPNRVAPWGFYSRTVLPLSYINGNEKIRLDSIVYVHYIDILNNIDEWAVGQVMEIEKLTKSQFLVQFSTHNGISHLRWFHFFSGNIRLELPDDACIPTHIEKKNIHDNINDNINDNEHNYENNDENMIDDDSDVNNYMVDNDNDDNNDDDNEVFIAAEIPYPVLPSNKYYDNYDDNYDENERMKENKNIIRNDNNYDYEKINNFSISTKQKSSSSSSSYNKDQNHNQQQQKQEENEVITISQDALLDLRLDNGRWVAVQVDLVRRNIKKPYINVTLLNDPLRGRKKKILLESLTSDRIKPIMKMTGLDKCELFKEDETVQVLFMKDQWVQGKVIRIEGEQFCIGLEGDYRNDHGEKIKNIWVHNGLNEIRDVKIIKQQQQYKNDNDNNIREGYLPFHALFEHESPMLSSQRGLIGIQNLGNTCYIAAAIQLLISSPSLEYYFLQTKIWQEYLHRNNDNNNTITLEFIHLLDLACKSTVHDRSYLSSVSSVSISKLKQLIDKNSNEFIGFEQHDCQEFLFHFLNLLHQELNQSNNNQNQNNNRDLLNISQSVDVEDEKKNWNYFKKSNASVISDLTYGQIKSTITCNECYYDSSVYNCMNLISLDLPQEGEQEIRSNGFFSRSYDKPTTLEDCIEKYLRPEILAGENQWYCPKCKVKRRAIKQLKITRLPNILLFQLKRFDPITGERKDIITQHPLELEIDTLVSKNDIVNHNDMVNHNYSLIGVVNHVQLRNSLHHYTCYTKLRRNKWGYFDDSKATNISTSDVLEPSSNPYVLMYERDVA